MLYERWREVARENRNEVAIHGVENNTTFGQLERLAEDSGGENTQDVGIKTTGREFIVQLLQAWRMGKVVVPLDPEQVMPKLADLPAQCVHLKMTSATGGQSRVVAFTGEQLAADAENIRATMGLKPEWPNLAVISLAHSYGFSNLVLPLLLQGIPLIVVDSPLPEIVRRAAKRVEAVTLPAVPALWQVWHSSKAIPGNVKLAISAGASLPLNLEAEVFNETGIKIHNFYGSSECGGIAYDDTVEPRAEAAMVGRPMKNVELTVGAEGCLEVRGAAVGMTYWPEQAESLANGVFKTSDVAEIIHGSVYLRGRAGDVINVAGRKIAPEEIERQLLEHPGVKNCLVFGVPDLEGQRGDTVVACIVGAGTLTGQELKQHLLGKLPSWQIPREWVFVREMEVNARGKLSRAEWRARYLKGSLTHQ